MKPGALELADGDGRAISSSMGACSKRKKHFRRAREKETKNFSYSWQRICSGKAVAAIVDTSDYEKEWSVQIPFLRRDFSELSTLDSVWS